MSNQLKQFDVRALLAIVVRRKWLVIVPTVIVTIAAFVASFAITPQYESSVLIYVSNPVSLAASLLRSLGEFRDRVLSADAGRVNVLELRSELLTLPYVSRIVEEAKLQDDSAITQQAQARRAEEPESSIEQLRIDIITDQLSGSLKLEYVTDHLLRISLRSSDPYRARTLAVAVGEVFIREKVRRSEQAVNQSLQFSYGQLTDQQRIVQQKMDEKARLDLQIEAIENARGTAVLPGSRQAILSEIEDRTLELGRLDSGERTLKESLDRLALGVFRVEASPAITEKRKLLDSLVSSLLARASKDAGMGRIDAESQVRLAQIEDEIYGEYVRIVASAYPTLDRATHEEMAQLMSMRLRGEYIRKYLAGLRDILGDRDSEAARLPELRAQRDILSQEIESAGRFQGQLKDQQETFDLAMALVQQARYEVVERGRLRLSPVWPDRRIILALGLLAGLAMGGLAVFVVEASDRSLSSPEHAENYLGLPVVGTVPRIQGIPDQR